MTAHDPTRRERWIRTLLLAFIVGVLVTVALLTGGPRSGRLEAGSTAPDYSLPATSGETDSLQQHRGRPVYLLFWATWCDICTVELEAMAELTDLPEARDVVFRTIAMNDLRDIERHRRRAGIPWEAELPILLDADSRAARAYRIDAVPTSILIDGEGKIVRSFEGSVGKRTLAGALDKLR